MLLLRLKWMSILGIFLASPVRAESIAALPIVLPNSIEDSACYFKMSDGRVLSLNAICGHSEPISGKVETSRKSAGNLFPNSPFIPLKSPDFRPIAGANPSNPFGGNSNPNQCYIVDLEGNACK